MSVVALVVDDSMLIRHTVCRFLEERGFTVESATNGREALEALKRVRPDIIVTDIQMPTMSDEDEEAARIVVQSGQASISYLQRRLRIGFSRAARLVDMMEMEGLVSPAAGGKPREVLVDKAYFDEVDAQLR